MTEEVPLEGGFLTDVVRVGDTVRRTATDRTPWIHDLLRFLRAAGFDAAPEPIGIDERGREVLTFVDGETRRGSEPDDGVLVDVMGLARRLHDLTAGSAFAEGGECVVHRDLSPRNTVFRGGRPIALLDWDGAGPGRRVEDVSRACWQFVEHGAGVDPKHVGRRWRLMADAYGLDEGRSTLVVEIAARMDESADRYERLAAAGVPAFERLVELGAPATVRSVRDWVFEHRAALEAAVGLTA
ncbi:MAG TPA: phosphotransferase [Acidimicrobiales bacterium]|nr:phosphotransferase [Acidimicrobiales bacterium]